MGTKTYTLTIEYNDETEQVEYITEHVDVDEFECLVEFESSKIIDMSEYWDEEALELAKQIYDVGVS